MKLIANNLRGELKGGQQYRILLSDKVVETGSRRGVFIYKEFYHECVNVWVMEESIIETYCDIRERKKAFKKALLQAEEKWGIQLLKADLKIVA
ncbi:hypothetical protein [Flavicella sediminum]|uniref:hypothetical protein n=1 Tax=Flavicella sediminum TaxID=2585141 RepID=UPI00111D91DE|nr:hypothetical protein [Flavicella sediminum]